MTRPATRTAPERVRLVIVDDHGIFRHGLRSVLEREPDLEVVGEAADPAAALAAVAAHRPDVVLLDLRLGDTEADGLGVCAEVSRRHPDVGVVVLTTFLDERLMGEAIRRGARGYVLKDVDVDDLVKVVRAVHRGESGFDSRSAAALVRTLSRAGRAPAPPPLTDREREVVRLIARGLSNREIGGALHISESTAKFHVRNITRKLHVANRAGVVYAAGRLALL